MNAAVLTRCCISKPRVCKRRFALCVGAGFQVRWSKISCVCALSSLEFMR